MSDSAITVQNLSKRYVIGHESRHDNLRDSLHHTARKLWRRFRWGTGFQTEDFWALRDVSFEVKRGEVVGIIGRNGAGKSTLLKILSRITEPTSGRVAIRGRVASLLEVGTGFHPELTGRDNIFLNGAILGMKRAEIRRKFDEIVAFAEVERFLDTPVKHYSSGMYVRLAFAVAAHLEPEILIVDEVLAVGDAQFQKKCLGKMNDVATRQGRTVLFVSHNMTAMRSLCTRGVFLHQGSVLSDGPMAETSTAYARGFAEAINHRDWPDFASAPGTGSLRFRSICLRPQDEGGPSLLTVASAFDLEVVLTTTQRMMVSLSVEFRLSTGEIAMVVASPPSPMIPGQDRRYRCRIPGNLLNDESYLINVMLVEDAKSLFVLPEALIFEIHDLPRTEGWLGKWPGVIRPLLSWKIE